MPDLAVLPRPRTLVHPGPYDPVRIRHMHAPCARHFRLALAPGRSLFDAIVEPLLALGMTSASMTVLGGGFERLHFCVAQPEPSGRTVASYTAPMDAGAAFMIFGNATLGKTASGAPIVHCHAAFRGADGRVRGGHILGERSVIAAQPIPVLVTAFEGFELRVKMDHETNMPLLQPQMESTDA
jgi:predicted DNA-binding protein with PD1-like motif